MMYRETEKEGRCHPETRYQQFFVVVVVVFPLVFKQNNDLMCESDHSFYTCGRARQVFLAS